MANIVCYDSDGQLLSHYTQWDVNQKLVITGADISSAPNFYFSNALIDDAYVVKATISNGGLVVDVPNEILQYNASVIVHIQYRNGETEYEVRIPVMPRKKPDNYLYPDAGSGGSTIGQVYIANNLTTNDATKVLSAAQGVVIKSGLDVLNRTVGDMNAIISDIEEAIKDIGHDVDVSDQINAALQEAKNSGVFDGRGILSVEKTSGNGSAGTTDVYTMTFTDMTTFVFTIYNGTNGSGGYNESGENGATFTPSLDSSGNLSWTNDKGLPNPPTVNIKGRNGDPGRGIVSVLRTDGDGSAGSIDTYTITYTDNTTSTFTIYNGANGTGDGGDNSGISVTGAKSGQIVKISKVNEMGQPIAWEAIDRTHYDEHVEVLPETVITSLDENNNCILPNILNLIVGQEYIVRWNNTDYICAAAAVELSSGTFSVCLGNLAFEDSSMEATSEPFLIYEIASDPSCTKIHSKNSLNAFIRTMKVSIYHHAFRKLDNKYLNLDWIPSKVERVILKEQIVESNGSLAAIDVQYLVQGTPIIVYINGVPHESVIEYTEGDGFSTFFTAKVSTDVNGSVFLFFSDKNTITMSNAVRGQSIKICLPGYEYDKIPQEYMPYGPGGISVTGAVVGQTVMISEVDENGVPVKWDPVYFPISGEGGVVFTPSVDSLGNLSWENNGSLENPRTVNLKGPSGYSPKRGVDYWTNEDILEIKNYIDDAILRGEW